MCSSKLHALGVTAANPTSVLYHIAASQKSHALLSDAPASRIRSSLVVTALTLTKDTLLLRSRATHVYLNGTNMRLKGRRRTSQEWYVCCVFGAKAVC